MARKFEYSGYYTPPPISNSTTLAKEPPWLARKRNLQHAFHSEALSQPCVFVSLDADESQRNQSLGRLPTHRVDFLIG